MGLLKIGQWGDNIESESERAGYYLIFLRRSAPERASDLFGGSYFLHKVRSVVSSGELLWMQYKNDTCIL